MKTQLCPYCHTDRDGYTQLLPREGNGQVSLHWHHPAFGGWMLHFTGRNHTRMKIKINFCPMCGRKLKEDTGNG